MHYKACCRHKLRPCKVRDASKLPLSVQTRVARVGTFSSSAGIRDAEPCVLQESMRGSKLRKSINRCDREKIIRAARQSRIASALDTRRKTRTSASPHSDNEGAHDGPRVGERRLGMWMPRNNARPDDDPGSAHDPFTEVKGRSG